MSRLAIYAFCGFIALGGRVSMAQSPDFSVASLGSAIRNLASIKTGVVTARVHPRSGVVRVEEIIFDNASGNELHRIAEGPNAGTACLRIKNKFYYRDELTSPYRRMAPGEVHSNDVMGPLLAHPLAFGMGDVPNALQLGVTRLMDLYLAPDSMNGLMGKQISESVYMVNQPLPSIGGSEKINTFSRYHIEKVEGVPVITRVETVAVPTGADPYAPKPLVAHVRIEWEKVHGHVLPKQFIQARSKGQTEYVVEIVWSKVNTPIHPEVFAIE